MRLVSLSKKTRLIACGAFVWTVSSYSQAREASPSCVRPREVIGWCKAHLVDHSIVDPQLLLIEKAVAAGNGQADFAYLYAVLKKSSA